MMLPTKKAGLSDEAVVHVRAPYEAGQVILRRLQGEKRQ
jgi:hypothetical protein